MAPIWPLVPIYEGDQNTFKDVSLTTGFDLDLLLQDMMPDWKQMLNTGFSKITVLDLKYIVFDDNRIINKDRTPLFMEYFANKIRETERQITVEEPAEIPISLDEPEEFSDKRRIRENRDRPKTSFRPNRINIDVDTADSTSLWTALALHPEIDKLLCFEQVGQMEKISQLFSADEDSVFWPKVDKFLMNHIAV